MHATSGGGDARGDDARGGDVRGGDARGNDGRAPMDSWRNRGTLLELAATVAALAMALVLFSRFILYVESRRGVVLPDPILASFEARDVTIPIFAIIYGGILLAIVTSVAHPRVLLLTLRSYALLVMVRIAVMYTIPLEPPAGMITLIDPIYSLGPGNIITRDLFFSGHTATMFLLFLNARKPWARNLLLACTFAMGVLVLWQHCHYSVDVVAAPFFAYGCYRMARGKRR